MIETKALKNESVDRFFERLRMQGYRILAPTTGAKGESWYREVQSTAEVQQDRITTLSAKPAVFPPVEEILRFRQGPEGVQLDRGTSAAEPTLLFGVRPCDARALCTLDSVFLSDRPDVFYKARRDAAIVVAISCSSSDPDCFCTSVGGGPGDTQGSDILLTGTDSDCYLVEIVTEKGLQVVGAVSDLFEPAQPVSKAEHLAQVPVRFSAEQLASKLPRLFDEEILWQEQSLACLGCGTCAFVCPACSCFDIEDEADLRGGSRLRCWDSCGQKLFTLHASGHNPRSQQSQRWRQRVMHKFSYLPETKGLSGCVGCGRCSRACPAGMNLLEHLVKLAEAES